MSVDDHLPALGSRWRRERPKNLVLEAGDRHATSASKVARIYHFSGLFDMATWVNGYSYSRETYFIELSRPCIVHSSFGILLFELV
jgi:hypothetical protein